MRTARSCTVSSCLLATFLVLGAVPSRVDAQRKPGEQASSNLKLMSHIALGAYTSVTDIEVEQDLARPYVYVSRRLPDPGFDVISVKQPEHAQILYRWRIENKELHQGSGGMRGVYFKLKAKYYYVQSLQFTQGGPDADLGAAIFDVTGLPDVTKVKEVGRIRAPDATGGFHNVYAYKHSDGRVLIFATSGHFAKIYDMEKFLAGDAEQGLVGKVPVPPTPGQWSQGYHDFYVAFDPAKHMDKFYGAGGAGYYVFDVTRTEDPKLLFTVLGVPGIGWGHTFTPSPDGRYAIVETEFQHQPLRMLDLKPGQDGEVQNISRPIGAWHADWKNLAHNTEVRWPYIFTSSYEDGLFVINMMDPTNPTTVGFYDTFDGPHNKRPERGVNSPYTWGIYIGAFGVDVRNADGLIVISDGATGFWSFKMEGFDGWNGHDWGMPNISSVQDWDNGPEGAAKPAKPVTMLNH